ncbi:LuxR C-terminal-related transcriptional regulator [Actinoplanes sp. NPDC048796]|uniref:helix-turn-helix transcriptional regulator n=1 Tax=Actinoplanes sp. NPDC048796 TaxID=3155640 RepID=UPI0033D8438A
MPDILGVPGPGLIGREREQDRLAECLSGGGAVLFTGERGIGKSRLLDAAAGQARRDGHRIVQVHVPPDPQAGPPPDPQAGPLVGAPALIRRLLLALRHDLPGLPGPAARAARAALGLHTDQAPAAAPPTGGDVSMRSALCAVVAAIDRRRPVLIIADDVDRLAPDEAALLAELGGAARALVAAGCGGRIPAALAGLPVVELGPLDRESAVRLVEAQADPPLGRRRAEILHRAAGNPAALVELCAGLPAARILQTEFGSKLAALPEPTRRLLLHLAVAVPPADPERVAAAAGDETWPPAERAGLVSRTGAVARFAHPLAAEAAYRSGSVHQRHQAHHNLAAKLPPASAEYALHLAAVTSGPDEPIASALESAAAVFRARGALFEAATAMEQAAERSPAFPSAARRYAQAALDARNLGEPEWTGELYAQVRRLTSDPDPVNLAAHAAATALSRAGRQHEAYGMVAAARRAGSPADPRTASALAGLAAVVAATSGDEEHRLGLAPMLAETAPDADPLVAAFVRLVLEPASHAGRAVCDATPVPAGDAVLTPADRYRLNIVGTIAAYENRSRLAVGLLRSSMGGEPDPRSSLTGIEMMPTLVGALIDVGDWAEAERQAQAVDGAGLPVLAAGMAALRAQVHALRGDAARARRLARQTVTRIDIRQHRAIHVRLLRAESLASTIDGDYENAYRHLRSMFDGKGRPLHSFLAPRHVADLAAAAVRSGRAADARVIVDRVRLGAGDRPSVRLTLLLDLAEALLGYGERAEEHFRRATGDPAAGEWPYERAVAWLHYGEWLRRARRPRDARTVLSRAEDAFHRLGAVHAAELAGRELRAGGQRSGGEGPLTAQERQVAELAARGLRNKEIAERLFISVRTVAAHLRSVYPKLGVSGRGQLGDALPR